MGHEELTVLPSPVLRGSWMVNLLGEVALEPVHTAASETSSNNTQPAAFLQQ